MFTKWLQVVFGNRVEKCKNGPPASKPAKQNRRPNLDGYKNTLLEIRFTTL